MSSMTRLDQGGPLLTRRLPAGVTVAQLLLFAITLFALALHLVNLQAIGDANAYYTAAVKSMLQSWDNFFFAAAEPGGSVSVDKPPLGLWIEAAFALVFGVSGVVVSLPNIIAGVLSVLLVYHLVQKHWGEAAGLIAALALAVTPVFVATNRNNTMDGMLAFTLLLAAWAFVRSAEEGKDRWLYLGTVIVGLGFNIKMLQAFLPLPAFYALYYLGSRNRWYRKLLNLTAATVILLIVSLSWAVIVDLTPADERPFVGSSENNTVMELIIGHNGLSRLLNPRTAGSGAVRGADNQSPDSDLGLPSDTSSGDRQLQPLQGSPPPGRLNRPRAGLADGPYASPARMNPGSTPFSQETGTPGVLRFFSVPLSKQMSWLLPFALISMLVLASSGPHRFPLEPGHQALLLWGGWLSTCLVFFSSVEGIFHAYYAIMLAPPLAALVGGGFTQLWRWADRKARAWGVLAASAALTVAFQIYSASQYGVKTGWELLAVILLLLGLVLALNCRTRSVTPGFVLASLLVIPTLWTLLTVLNESPDVNLPTAYAGSYVRRAPAGAAPLPSGRTLERRPLVEYLEAHTQDMRYLVAVPSSQVGAPLVLQTGRPVLYLGGFNGGDPVIDAVGLEAMVAEGELRFVLLTGESKLERGISEWVTAECSVVPMFSPSQAAPGTQLQPPDGTQRPASGSQTVLYDCGS
jgi:4-amino-4-deoxy-L-arabinose transferase-like glycosyltransferase